MDFSQHKDYYKILEVSQNATSDEIKSAYRRLAKEFHPDLHASNPLLKLANEKFKEINEAYEILTDESKRKLYDDFRVNPTGNSNKRTEREENDYTEQQTYEYKKKSEVNYSEEKRNNTTQDTYQNSRSQSTSEKAKKTGVTACHFHNKVEAVENCEVCGVALCEECTSLFETSICPKCAMKNNDLYSAKLLQPLYFGIISIIVGAITGIVLGVKFNLLKDYGIAEGIIGAIYLLGFALYTFYFYHVVSKYTFKILYIFLDLFDASEDAGVAIVNLVSILIGLAIGWIIGLSVGAIKAIKDLKRYFEFKNEYKKIKEYICENYKL